MGGTMVYLREGEDHLVERGEKCKGGGTASVCCMKERIVFWEKGPSRNSQYGRGGNAYRRISQGEKERHERTLCSKCSPKKKNQKKTIARR